MKRPQIKTALTAIMLGMSSLVGILAWVSWTGFNTLNSATVVISDDSVPSIQLLGKINIEFAQVRLGIRDHVISQSPEEMDKVEQKLADHREALRRSIDEYKPLLSGDDEKAIYDSMVKEVGSYLDNLDGAIKLSRGNRTEEARVYMRDVLLPLAKTAGDYLDEQIEHSRKAAAEAAAAAAAAFSQTLFILWSVLAVAAVAACSALAFAVMGISRPIAAITQSMRGLAAGDSDTAIPFAGRQDEIGAMAGAVEVFRQAAITNKRLEQEAEESRRQAELERIETERRAEEAAAERLRIATSGLAAGLKRMAAGDLSFQLTDAFAPDFEALRHDFNASIAQLGTAMSGISSSTMSIDTSTREIASGAGDLARRTEQQAAALEETAAALDEITVNVTNSTRKTEEARSVASQANRSAAESAEVVSHAEEAMRRIEGSSTQISNIIGVIDEIAFQTNLLALNAGVEAARAGEAGKGFAVVAQEVRELAQRSASAAKEIKGLIQNSSNEVQAGVKLVRDAGEALKTICAYITEINAHMDSIAVSAKEQSTGLHEVNQAVNQMDQVTQSNAAMVEQSNAAAESLASEAVKLRELVSQFRTDGPDQGHGQAATLRQTAQKMAALSRGQNPGHSAAASAPQPRPAPQKIAAAGGGGGNAATVSWEEF